MIYLALSTGLRCSELVGLFIEDVSPFEGISRILVVPSRIGKNGKKRDIPINHDTQSVLSIFIRAKQSREQFTNSNSYLFVSHYTLKLSSNLGFFVLRKEILIIKGGNKLCGQ